MDEDNVTFSDTQHMLKLGKDFGRAMVLRKRRKVLRAAAEFYILAANATEEARLLYWWLEGTIDYAVSQFELDEWEKKFNYEVWKVSQEDA